MLPKRREKHWNNLRWKLSDIDSSSQTDTQLFGVSYRSVDASEQILLPVKSRDISQSLITLLESQCANTGLRFWKKS